MQIYKGYLTGQVFTPTFPWKINVEAILMFWKRSDLESCLQLIGDKFFAGKLSKKKNQKCFQKKNKKKDSTVQSAIRGYFLQKPSSHVKSQWWLKAFYDTT